MKRNLLPLLILALLMFAPTAPTAASPAPQTVKNWQQIKLESAPPARYDHITVLAADVNKLVLFGGRAAGKPLGDTWIFAENKWREVKTSAAPEARFGSAAAYDTARKRVLLFAGQQSSFFNDVWAFDVAKETWSKIEAKGTAPAARYGTSAVIDPKNDLLIISHGFASGRFDDTFAFDLKTNEWKDLAPAVRPMKRCLHEAVYHEDTGQMFLYGGCSSGVGPCPQGDLWAFEAAEKQWVEIKPKGTAPAPRSNPALIAASDGSLWLHGGRTGDGKYSDELWSFDPKSGEWTQHKVEGAPAGRSSHDAVWDAANQRLIIFGGSSSDGQLNDLWVFVP